VFLLDFHVYIYLLGRMGGSKEEAASHCSVVPAGSARVTGHKLKRLKFHLNIRKHCFSCESGQTLSLHQWEYSKSVWTWSWATYSAKVGLSKMVSGEDPIARD